MMVRKAMGTPKNWNGNGYNRYKGAVKYRPKNECRDCGGIIDPNDKLGMKDPRLACLCHGCRLKALEKHPPRKRKSRVW
jgi:hypothetical protein